jgi:hypothetical protein
MRARRFNLNNENEQHLTACVRELEHGGNKQATRRSSDTRQMLIIKVGEWMKT